MRFSMCGRQVKILADRTLNIGEHSFMWNGRNSNGRKVSSGSYFYRLSAGEDVMIRRMILIK
ncbi:MAG: hypothetical protein J7K40_12920 [candidate division Zixibacteria bacterium]|nr:hypothetical protein [candidate division Zixibacteria bacterium]